MRANRAGQVRPRLPHAADAPLQRLLHEPPVERGAVDWSAAGAFVGREQLVDRADAADLVRRTEAPCLHAQPGQVLHGVTDVHQLPVDDGGEPFPVDDDVAHAQVAVHQRRRRARRTVGLEPLVGLLEGRAAIGHHAVRRPVARQLVDLGHARAPPPDRSRADPRGTCRAGRRAHRARGRTRRRAGSCARASRPALRSSPTRPCRGGRRRRRARSRARAVPACGRRAWRRLPASSSPAGPAGRADRAAG